MNEPAADGQYHYVNRDLGFSLVLPEDFIYYQTQRVRGSGYTDLEFFVPTSDTEYPQAVPGYGQPIIVRIFSSEAKWKSEENKTTDDNFKRVGDKNGQVYTMIFWETVPSDWKQIWNESYKEQLVKNLKVL